MQNAKRRPPSLFSIHPSHYRRTVLLFVKVFCAQPLFWQVPAVGSRSPRSHVRKGYTTMMMMVYHFRVEKKARPFCGGYTSIPHKNISGGCKLTPKKIGTGVRFPKKIFSHSFFFFSRRMFVTFYCLSFAQI